MIGEDRWPPWRRYQGRKSGFWSTFFSIVLQNSDNDINENAHYYIDAPDTCNIRCDSMLPSETIEVSALMIQVSHDPVVGQTGFGYHGVGLTLLRLRSRPTKT